MTDGEIHDMAAVKDLVCQAAGKPCSIIIVGVGNEAFTMMEELDGDEQKLRDSNGRECARDIVQFVRFRECAAKGNLAEEVLKEIPEQLCSYMESINYVPRPVQVDPNVYMVQAQATPG